MKETRYSDDELKSLIVNKDQVAMTYVYEKYGRAVETMADRVGGSKFDMDEIRQSVFLKVFDKIAQYDPSRGMFFTWMATIARNHAIDELRKIKTMERRAAGMFTELRDDNYWEPVENDSRYVTMNIGGLVMSMKPYEVTLIELRYFMDLKFEDIAERLGQPLGTVKTNHFRVIRKLRGMVGIGG